MKNTIRNLLFLSCLLFAVSYDCCTLGVNYAGKHDPYQGISFSGGWSYNPYVERWELLGATAFSLAVLAASIGLVAWRRKKQDEDLRRSILIKER